MYNAFYGFSGKPFETVPDPRFIYLTSGRREILNSLIQGIKEGKEFIAITGSAGTGKTALCHYLLINLENEIKSVFLPRPLTTLREFVGSILSGLNPAAVREEKINPFNRLMHTLNRMSAGKERLVLMIDEAQSLSMEAAEELRIFLNRAPKIVQIVFIGQPEFADRLDSPGLRWLKERISLQHQIEPLAERESLDYIGHRLRLVGGNSRELLTPQALALICHRARGTPLSLNILCDNAFRIGHVLSRKPVDTDVVRMVIDELEGPEPTKERFPSIGQNRTKWPSFLRLKGSPKHVVLLILFLFCLGVLILLARGTFQRKSVQWGNIETVKSPAADVHPIAPNPFSLPFPPPLSLPSGSLAPEKKERPLIERTTVKTGETVSFLSQKYYRMTNATLVDVILDFNPEISNVHLILVHQEINIPKITEELFIIQSPEGTYKIHAGTFETPEASRSYHEEPSLAGKEIEIIPRKVSPRETWYRVMVGNFEGREEAMKTLHLLKEKKLLPPLGR